MKKPVRKPGYRKGFPGPCARLMLAPFKVLPTTHMAARVCFFFLHWEGGHGRRW